MNDRKFDQNEEDTGVLQSVILTFLKNNFLRAPMLNRSAVMRSRNFLAIARLAIFASVGVAALGEYPEIALGPIRLYPRLDPQRLPV